jgi:hypothetical protein
MLFDREDAYVTVERRHLKFQVVQFARMIAALLPSVHGARHAARLLDRRVIAGRDLQYLPESIANDKPRHDLTLPIALGLAATLHVLAVRSLVGLNVFQTTLLIAFRVKLAAIFAAMSRAIRHVALPRQRE